MRVFCWTLSVLLDVIEDSDRLEGGRSRLLEGIGVSPRQLARPWTRMPWDDYTVVLDRIADLLGGSDLLVACGRAAFPRANGLVQSLAGSLASVRLLYLVGASVTGPRLWPATRGYHEDVSSSEFRQTVVIDDACRDSEPFFQLVRGLLAGAPSALGLPNAEVQAEIRPRRAVYSITAPLAGTLFDRPAGSSAVGKVLAYQAGFPRPRQSDRDRRAAETDLLDGVRIAIAAELTHRRPTAVRVASRLSLTERTLIRRLSERGTTFRQLRDETRRELAVSYLADDRSIAEVAYELGYGDISSFHRAFRRWTGATPSEFQPGRRGAADPSVPGVGARDGAPGRLARRMVSTAGGRPCRTTMAPNRRPRGDTMSVTVYDHPLSPYAQKVKIALAEKGVAFEAPLPEAIGSGVTSGAFAEASPRGEVPALVDEDGTRVFDSTVILEYVEERWPEPPLLPASPAERARVRMLEDVMDTHFEAITWGLAEIDFFGRASGELAERMKATAGRQIAGWLAWLSAQLGERTWFNGERFGWGDLCVAPFLNGAAGFGHAPRGGLLDWLERVNERPSVAACAKAAAEAGAQSSEIGLEQVRRLLDQGLFKREYRDHRLEWMVKSGGLEIVTAGLEKGNVRFIDPFA